MNHVSEPLADVSSCEPLEPTSAFPIGSHTKMFVAAVIYQLQEEGEIVSFHEKRLSDFGLAGTGARIEFFQGDASAPGDTADRIFCQPGVDLEFFSQTLVQSLVLERQAIVIDSQLIQDRRVQVFHM